MTASNNKLEEKDVKSAVNSLSKVFSPVTQSGHLAIKQNPEKKIQDAEKKDKEHKEDRKHGEVEPEASYWTVEDAKKIGNYLHKIAENNTNAFMKDIKESETTYAIWLNSRLHTNLYCADYPDYDKEKFLKKWHMELFLERFHKEFYNIELSIFIYALIYIQILQDLDIETFNYANAHRLWLVSVLLAMKLNNDDMQDERDLSLMSLAKDENVSNIDKIILQQARQTHTPILIKTNNEYYLYGDKKGDGKWDLTAIDAEGIDLSKLPFDQKLIKHDHVLFNQILKTIVKQGHALFIPFIAKLSIFFSLPKEEMIQLEKAFLLAIYNRMFVSVDIYQDCKRLIDAALSKQSTTMFVDEGKTKIGTSRLSNSIWHLFRYSPLTKPRQVFSPQNRIMQPKVKMLDDKAWTEEDAINISIYINSITKRNSEYLEDKSYCKKDLKKEEFITADFYGEEGIPLCDIKDYMIFFQKKFPKLQYSTIISALFYMNKIEKDDIKKREGKEGESDLINCFNVELLWLVSLDLASNINQDEEAESVSEMTDSMDLGDAEESLLRFLGKESFIERQKYLEYEQEFLHALRQANPSTLPEEPYFKLT